MPNCSEEHLSRILEGYGKRDPELVAELRSKFRPGLERVSEHAFRLQEAMPQKGDKSRFLESIVRAHARPVFLIRENKLVPEFVGPDSKVWESRLKEALGGINAAIPSVGRVEVQNDPDYPWLGTAWLVAEDIVVTNRHVAREFARGSSDGFVFRSSALGVMASSIDFLEEFDRTESLEFPVVSILWIAPESDEDIAFLRLAPSNKGNHLAQPLRLSSDPPVQDDFVVTIGYPARDGRVPDQELVKQIFGDVYDKKRLAPGQIISVFDTDIQHDCSTLGGSSGSLVFNYKSGEAVGLHYSGEFMKANYAVRVATVDDRLLKITRGDRRPPSGNSVKSDSRDDSPPPRSSPELTNSVAWTIPLEITIRIGQAGQGVPVLAATPPSLSVTPPPPPSVNKHESALAEAKKKLSGNPDVLDVRLGYRFRDGWITDERVVVVEVRRKMPAYRLEDHGKTAIPRTFSGVGVDVRSASLITQLSNQGLELPFLERVPTAGQYRKPANLSLQSVNEPVKAIFHVSPDAGFPNLQPFLLRTQERITATMYEFDAGHIFEALVKAIKPDDRTLEMVSQDRPPKSDDMEKMVESLKDTLGKKFDQVWASVGKGLLFPSAYHIKVAVRDGKETWLSSGNWKNSGQPDIKPAADHETKWTPLLQKNREWHAIIESENLAEQFESYIRYDFKEAHRLPLPEAREPEVARPDVFVPEEAFFEERVAGKPEYFEPLEKEGRLKIQPLLTPDNYQPLVLSVLESAEKSIYFQNQSFNLLGLDKNGDDPNQKDFLDLLGVLKDKQKTCDVRIIFRDGKEFSRNTTPQDQLLERLKDFGFDTDRVRLQMRCHTKGIVVDSSVVVLGSHNWTNEGTLFNRDASLIIRDADVARYFESIFLFDWEHLAHQKVDELLAGVRIAQPGEATPPGMRRVPFADLFDD